ncbi:MAG: DNA polymerase III subunit delta' [Woeseiaceae bacterium]|nr:DNA polymerase III subunit delta' [Woeseiaceae bacterium]
MQITWHEKIASAWLDRIHHGRLPHAVLLTGPPGVGKRAAAVWMASHRLVDGFDASLPEFPVQALEHPDLRRVSPPEEKTTIGIEQIRDLVVDLGLTSFEGAGKVAIIEPANAMTINAANSLLKTLEEPPGDTLLILVADRHGRLPATIFSRCQRIEFQPPGEPEGLAWLDRLQPGAHWAEALALAGNAPIGAIETLEQLETHAAMRKDLADLSCGRVSPLEVAARWGKLDVIFVLNWMSWQVQKAILAASTGSESPVASAIDKSVLNRMDRRNLFCYLDTINRLRGQPTGSYNVQLTLESLLIDWSEGLANVRAPAFAMR